MRIDPLQALSDMRTRQALDVPLPEDLRRALRGEVSPHKPAQPPNNPEPHLPADRGGGAGSPDAGCAAPSGAATVHPTARHAGAAEANGASAAAPDGGGADAAVLDASPPRRCAAAAQAQAATPIDAPQLGPAALESPVRPATNGSAAGHAASPGSALGSRDGSGLAVGSWTTTNKRSPQKHSPGAVRSFCFRAHPDDILRAHLAYRVA